MGIFGLFALWRIKDLLEQIRRNQLTPAERVAEDTTSIEEEIAERTVLLVILIPVLASLLIFGCFFMNG